MSRKGQVNSMLVRYVPPEYEQLKILWCRLLKRPGVEEVVKSSKSETDLYANLLSFFLHQELRDKQAQLLTAEGDNFNLKMRLAEANAELKALKKAQNDGGSPAKIFK